MKGFLNASYRVFHKKINKWLTLALRDHKEYFLKIQAESIKQIFWRILSFLQTVKNHFI